MRFLLICLVGLVFGCGDGDRSVGPVQGPSAVGDGLSVESVESVESLESLESLAALGVSAGKAVVSADSVRYGRAFLLASGSGNLGIVELLVRLGADVSATDEAGNTALHLSAANGHLDVVEFLVGAGLAVGAVNDAGETAGALASAAGHTDVVSYLESVAEAAAGLSVEEARAALDSLRINYTERAFFSAVRAGNLEVVKLFVWAGMSVDATTSSGRTALHWASFRGRLAVVEFLVGAGADVNARDEDGDTPRFLAALRDHTDVEDYLESVGAEGLGLTPGMARAELARRGKRYTEEAFFDAAKAGNLFVVRLFVAAGMDVDTHYFARTGRTVITFFVHGGSTRSPEVINTGTALLYAARRGHLGVVKFLVGAGADVHATNEYDSTALHRAARYGHLSVVEFLVGAGAAVYARDDDGDTALHWAAANGHLSVVEFVSGRGCGCERCEPLGPYA